MISTPTPKPQPDGGEPAGRGKCWYCGKPAVAVWHTTWDEPGQSWPMCATCQSNVRQALAHRAEDCHEPADALDEESGISTDYRQAGGWIDPADESPVEPAGG